MDIAEKKRPEFTGETFIPCGSPKYIADDHFARYKFAMKYADNKTVLDIACGAGYSAPLFIKAGAVSYTGVDIKDELVCFANQEYGSPQGKFMVGDICSFNDNSQYGLIVCFETIEHVKDYQSALANLFLLLEPGGTLLISSPNRRRSSPRALRLSDKPANEFHVQEFLPDELLEELHKAGFETTEDYLYGQRLLSRGIIGALKTLVNREGMFLSPKVSLVKDRNPEFFVIVANKPK
ncbi:MAG: class I SAM-dependent methyltransferase [Victivallaceae bacterium]|jgi:SAM-dependent methyltransferase